MTLMKKLSELFFVTYGSKFDLNKMKPLAVSKGGVSFVGRSSENHGVSATVAPVTGAKLYGAGLITVALGGAKLLSSFIQERPFYTAQNVAVLEPREKMTFEQKLYVCLCIRHNRFRYSAFGREANRTLRGLLIPAPEQFPGWIEGNTVKTLESYEKPVEVNVATLDVSKWKCFELQKLFTIKKGKRLTKAEMVSGPTPFIGAIDSNNGVAAHISLAPHHPAGTLTVNYNGAGVAETFYQPLPYRCSDDVNVLYPKFPLNPYRGIFIATILRREKYRFSYGRKWHLDRMLKTNISLPQDSSGSPDWDAMDCYMKSLPFSSGIGCFTVPA